MSHRSALSCALLLGSLSLLRAADAPAGSPVVIERAPEGAPAPSDAAALRAENRRLAEQLDAERKRADDADARFGTVTAGVDRLMQEKATLQAQLDQVQARETALRERLDAALQAAPKPNPGDEARLADLQRDLSAVQQREQALAAENERLKNTAGDRAKLETELNQLRQEKRARDASTAAATDMHARLRETQDKLETALRSYTQLEAENDKLKSADAERTAQSAEIENLRRLNAELQAKGAAAGEQRAADSEARFAEMEDKLSTTLRSYTQLQAENERLKAEAADVAALRSERETLQREKADLEARLATAAAAPATPPPAAPDPALADRLAQTEDKLNTVLRSYTLIQQERDELKANAERTTREAEATSAKVSSDAAARMSALFDELRQSRAQTASLAAENSELKTRLSLATRPAPNLLSSPVRPGTAAAVAAATPAPAPTPAAAGSRTHVVVLGDTLGKIARTYYGSANRWSEILEANRDVIQNENVLPVGTALKIP